MKKSPQKLLEQAGKHLEAFDFQKAADGYNRVMKEHPDNAAALMGLAIVCNRTGKNREALEILRKIWTALEASSAEQQATVHESTKAEILAQMGMALQLLGFEDKALPFYAEADRLFPTQEMKLRINGLATKQLNANPVAKLVAKARKLAAQGKVEQAAKAYREALQLNPDNDIAQHGLGDLLRRQGNFAQAMPLIQQAIIMQPAVAEYHNTLGMLFQQKGDFAKALVFHRRALDIEANYAAAHCNLGVALKNLNRPEEAVAEYRKALQISPNMPEAHNNLGNLYRILGKLDEAKASLTQALKLNPDYVDAKRNLQALLTAGKAAKKKPVPKAKVKAKVKPKLAAKPVAKSKPAKIKTKVKPKTKTKFKPKKKR